MFSCFCHVTPVVANTPDQSRKAKRHAPFLTVWAVPLILLLVGLMFGALKISAQESTADVLGTVTDSTGAVVTGAKVTLKNVNTGITRTSDSNNKGGYLFTYLNVGTYEVVVEAHGFRKFVAQDIAVSAGDRARIDAKLEVGAATETIAINASTAPALDTDSSSVGSTIPQQSLNDIPLDGRNLTDMIRLAPGVSTGQSGNMSVGYGTATEDSRPASGYVANGQQADTNNNMIDGGDNNEALYGTSGARPSLDAIQEVNVQTNLYSADVGRTAGGAVDVITKSGTNAFHGSLYEFLRNDLLDSRTITGETAKPELRQNQFGASIGGPIKKDKTFFFADYEGFRQVAGTKVTDIVPTALQRTGDFSELTTSELCEEPSGGGGPPGSGGGGSSSLNLGCALGQIEYPQWNSNNPNVTGPSSGITSLASAGITSFDTVGANLVSLYPAPNANLSTAFSDIESGSGGGFNYEAQPAATQFSTTIDGRIDQHFSDSDMLTGHYTINDYTTVTPTSYPGVSIDSKTYFGGAGQAAKQRVQKLSLDEVHIFRPTLLLDLKASYLRYANNVLTLNGENAATNFGFPCNADSCINSTIGGANYGLPNIQNGSSLTYAALGDNTSIPFHTFDNTYQYSGSLTWTHGNHAVKTGGSVTRRLLYFIQSGNGTLGEFQIDGAGTGNYIADLLVGAATGETRGTMNVAQHLRDWEPNAYVQDDWRVKPWLTLNLGMRWELVTPYTEENGYMANFDPVSQLIVSPILSGANHTTDTMGISAEYHDFAPRVGFSVSMPHNMVVRGGFGMSYFNEPSTAAQGASMMFQNNIGCGAGAYDSMAGQGCNVSNPALEFTNVDSKGYLAGLQSGGFAQLSAGIMPPWSLATAEANILSGRSNYPGMILPVSMNNVTPYLEQWSLQTEKQYGSNVITLGYVGNTGRHLHVGANVFGAVTPAEATDPGHNPAFNLMSNSTRGIYMNETIGTSNYNSMQVLYSRRFSQGLTSNVSYTWAHSMGLGVLSQEGPANSLACPRYGCLVDNPWNPTSPTTTGPKYDYGNTEMDLRHRITYMTSYDLPLGKSMHGILGGLVKGWGASTSGYWQTGTPFSVGYNGMLLGGAVMGPRADEVANPKKMGSITIPTLDGTGASCTPTTGAVFNTCAFQEPLTSNYYGNERRNQLFDPHTWSANGSMGKTFAIGERYKLNFRAESFNLTNTTNDGNPGATIAGSTFGEIVRSGSAGRQFQFGLRLSY